MVARICLAALLLLAAAGTALADLIFPSFTQRLGPYAPSGIPFADGYADYFTLLNERDGGINGVRIQVPECETGYIAERGIECFEAIRAAAPLAIQPLSTAITARLIPLATKEKIPVLSAGYGPGFIADGASFAFAFTYPASLREAAAVVVRQLLLEAGGDLKGKTIALVYLDSTHGREAVRVLQVLSVRHGFRLLLHPVPHPGLEQKAAWAAIAAEAPDHVLLWGWGIMTRIALTEAAASGVPMNRIVGAWASANEPDLVAAGAAADGFRTATFVGTGTDWPLYADLENYVYAPGKGAGDGTSRGHALYNQGLFAAVIAAEAARKAMHLNDRTTIDAVMMRDGLEKLDLDRERLIELGLSGFAAPLAGSCANHVGSGRVAIQRWDAAAARWRRTSGYIEPDRDLLGALNRADSIAFARRNGLEPRQCP